jgi:hypothetical protein
MCAVSIIDTVRNEDVCRRCGSEVSIGERMDRNVLSWYGHVERMEEERMGKRGYNAKVKVSRVGGRPKMRWMDGVKASPGYMFGNPKTHKNQDDPPIRPIISQVETPTYKVAKKINEIIMPYLPKDHSIKNREELL